MLRARCYYAPTNTNSSLIYTPRRSFTSSFPSPRLTLRVRVSASPLTIDANRKFRFFWIFHNNNITRRPWHIICA